MSDTEKLTMVIEINEHGQAIVKSVDKDFEKLEQTTEKTSSSFKQAKAAWAALTAAFAAVGISKVYHEMEDLIEISERQSKAVLGMEAVMKSMGRYTPELSSQLQDYADSLQDVTNYGNEATEEGIKFLMTYKDITDNLMPRSIKTMLDLAALMGGDTTQAANMLGRASMGMVGELRRVGLSVDALTFKNQGYLGVLKEIETQVSGQAKVMADPFNQLKNQMGDVEEKAGDIIRLFAEPFAIELIAELKEVNSELKTWYNNNKDLIAQNVPAYIRSIKGALDLLSDALLPFKLYFQYLQYIKNVTGALYLASKGVISYKDAITNASQAVDNFMKKFQHFPINEKTPGWNIYQPPPSPPKETSSGNEKWKITFYDPNQDAYRQMVSDYQQYVNSLSSMKEANENKFKIEFYDPNQDKYRQMIADYQVYVDTIGGLDDKLAQRRYDAMMTSIQSWQQEKDAMMGVITAQNMVQASISSLMSSEHVYLNLRQAVKNSIVSTILAYDNFGNALKNALAQVMAQIAAEAGVKAIFQTAEGFASLASYQYAQAGQHFRAAAIFASVAALAGVAAHTLAANSQGGGAEDQGPDTAGSLTNEANRNQQYSQKWDVTIVNPIGTSDWVENNLVPELKKVAKRDTEITINYA